MNGLVGYDDVVSLLCQMSDFEGQQPGWQECRSRLLSADRHVLASSLTSTDDSRLLRSWVQDECPKRRGAEYARFFWDLDSWTEYWDIYHPETHGRFYFGDGFHPGFLAAFLPSPTQLRNPVFEGWKRLALDFEPGTAPELQRHFESHIRQPHVTEAVLAVDELVLSLLREHFCDATGSIDKLAYLDAMERFGKDTLPACPERYERLPEHDPRKTSSLHHTIEGDIMWFGWAAHLECANLVGPQNAEVQALRCLMMAGVALGCSFDFAFRGRRRTRKQYLTADHQVTSRIWSAAQKCTRDFAWAAKEVRELFRIREYGDT
jgi:hypothetical protein